MQFSRTDHLNGGYHIGNEGGPPYFHECTNAASSTRPYVTQLSYEVSNDSNATGNPCMWYNGFTRLSPDPRYDETHAYIDPGPAYLPSQDFRTNPSQGSVQLVLDNFLAKLRCHNPTSVPTTLMDCRACDPPGFGGRQPPIGLGEYDKEGPAYIEYNPVSENHEPGHSIPITKLAFGAWKCLVCDKKLRRKQVAVVHFWNKHGGLRFNCEGRCGTQYCTKSFATRDALAVHLYPVMKDCSDCGHPMLRKNLRRHKEQYCHSGNRSMGKRCTKGMDI